MKPTKTFLFVSGAVVAGLVAIHVMNTSNTNQKNNANKIPVSSYGAFLAAQHALHTNNFDKANEFLYQIDETAQKYASVDEIRILTDFLAGKMPTDIKDIPKASTLSIGIVRDAYMIKNNKWDEVYGKYKNNSMRIMSPVRIWSGVATNHIKKTFGFINTLEANDSWQSFLRGQVYAEQGKPQKAADEFAKVLPEFLNVSDYMYLMSFYKHNNMDAQANNLRTHFTTKPGSMFMVNFTDVPEWAAFSGSQNQLAFNIVQTVAHNKTMSNSDLSLLLLHFAKNISDNNDVLNDAINYHSGLYMMGNNGDYNKYFARISAHSPYYPFVNLHLAESNHDMRAVKKAIDAQPLFIPAIKLLVGWQTQQGDRRAALKTIDKSIKNPDISAGAKAYLYKMRAETNFVFQDFDAAQQDLDDATALLTGADPDVFSTQARIWAATGQKLDEAYMYSLRLIKFAPMDNCSWDTLGYVIRAREGVMEALDIMSKVAEVAKSCSALFEHLGDMYIESGDKKLARDAYLRAIELSGDGLSVKPYLEKKLKQIQ